MRYFPPRDACTSWYRAYKAPEVKQLARSPIPQCIRNCPPKLGHLRETFAKQEQNILRKPFLGRFSAPLTKVSPNVQSMPVLPSQCSITKLTLTIFIHHTSGSQKKKKDIASNVSHSKLL